MKYIATLIVAAIVITAFAFGQSPQTGPLAKGVNNIAFQGSGTASVVINALATLSLTNITIPVTGAITNGVPNVNVNYIGSFPDDLDFHGMPQVVASGTVGFKIFNSGTGTVSSTNIMRATVLVPLVNP